MQSRHGHDVQFGVPLGCAVHVRGRCWWVGFGLSDSPALESRIDWMWPMFAYWSNASQRRLMNGKHKADSQTLEVP